MGLNQAIQSNYVFKQNKEVEGWVREAKSKGSVVRLWVVTEEAEEEEKAKKEKKRKKRA